MASMGKGGSRRQDHSSFFFFLFFFTLVDLFKSGWLLGLLQFTAVRKQTPDRETSRVIAEWYWWLAGPNAIFTHEELTYKTCIHRDTYIFFPCEGGVLTHRAYTGFSGLYPDLIGFIFLDLRSFESNGLRLPSVGLLVEVSDFGVCLCFSDICLCNSGTVLEFNTPLN